MSKRLQVLLDEKEFSRIRAIARQRKVTVAEWVRQTLRSGVSQEPGGGRDKKFAAIRAAASNRFPAGDIEMMLAEIERGYLGDGGK